MFQSKWFTALCFVAVLAIIAYFVNDEFQFHKISQNNTARYYNSAKIDSLMGSSFFDTIYPSSPFVQVVKGDIFLFDFRDTDSTSLVSVRETSDGATANLLIEDYHLNLRIEDEIDRIDFDGAVYLKNIIGNGYRKNISKKELFDMSQSADSKYAMISSLSIHDIRMNNEFWLQRLIFSPWRYVAFMFTWFLLIRLVRGVFQFFNCSADNDNNKWVYWVSALIVGFIFLFIVLPSIWSIQNQNPNFSFFDFSLVFALIGIFIVLRLVLFFKRKILVKANELTFFSRRIAKVLIHSINNCADSSFDACIYRDANGLCKK